MWSFSKDSKQHKDTNSNISSSSSSSSVSSSNNDSFSYSQNTYFKLNESNSNYEKQLSESLQGNVLVCRSCEILLGYKCMIQCKDEELLHMTGLINYTVDQDQTYYDEDKGNTLAQQWLRVICVGCRSELGIRYLKKNTTPISSQQAQYRIFRGMVYEKNRMLTAAVISLKGELCSDMEAIIGKLNEVLSISVTIHQFQVNKSDLKSFKLQFTYDIALIVHKEQGRLLLFDHNGMYHHLFQQCFNNTQGNVLLVLLMMNSSLNNHEEYYSGQQQQQQLYASAPVQLSSKKQESKNGINNNNTTTSTVESSEIQQQQQSQLDSSRLSSSLPSPRSVAANNNNILNKPTHQQQLQIPSLNPQFSSSICDSRICDKILLNDISINGKQPLLNLLVKNQLVMTISEQISTAQINFLSSFLFNAQSKPLIPQELANHIHFKKLFNRKVVTDKEEEAMSKEVEGYERIKQGSQWKRREDEDDDEEEEENEEEEEKKQDNNDGSNNQNNNSNNRIFKQGDKANVSAEKDNCMIF